ncbi:MAG TPA: arginine--tRNA ligase [Candidatus Omnitrophota bacterium]|nr:arginine--tRNA ligase [Candidatus Omnitrophota bacterium]
MLNDFKKQLQAHLQGLVQETYPALIIPEIRLETPANKAHGDLSCNFALISSKQLQQPPIVIAEKFSGVISGSFANTVLAADVAKVDFIKPGFINFYLTSHALSGILTQIFKEGDAYGRSQVGAGKKVQIEFVSANPTGPLSVAHARQGAVGDALGNILRFVGFDVTKEYYVNDEGNQINILGQSLKSRALEILGEKITFPEDHYQGEYIKDMARIFMEKNKVSSVDGLKKKIDADFMHFGVNYLMDIIKKELEDFGVHFDVWSYQSKIATKKNIEAILDYLGEKGFIYEKDSALWFKSTDFGDDKDRVLEKSDGSYTYITPDIVYHKNKFERGFEKVVNIWGPDHHGYIPRLTAAVEALGKDREALKVLIVQLATIYRDGKELSMSTRRGQYISLREVLDEVGSDAARFFFMMRHISAHLEFDLDLAKKQTPENPVYYVQYGHARVYSMNKKAKETGVKISQDKFDLLNEEEELDLIKKLGYFPDTLLACYAQWDPYPLVSYLQELASVFHRFYDKHRVISDDVNLSAQRLGLVNASRIVIANGLKLLGVNAPQQM